MWVVGGLVASAVVGAVSSSEASRKASNTAEDAAREANETQLSMYEESRQDQLPWMAGGEKALAELSGGTTYTGDRPVREEFYAPRTPVQQGEWGMFAEDQLGRQDFDQAAYDKAMAEYEATGVSRPGMIEAGPGEFRESPYYQEGLEEEEKAIDRYMASRGLYASGKAGKALSRNALANMERSRGNWLNEWITTKLNPTQSMARVGQTAATNIAGQRAQVGRDVAGGITDIGNIRGTGYIDRSNIATGAIQTGANALAQYYGSRPTTNANPMLEGPVTSGGITLA